MPKHGYSLHPNTLWSSNWQWKILNAGFIRNITYTWSIFQPAMFDKNGGYFEFPFAPTALRRKFYGGIVDIAWTHQLEPKYTLKLIKNEGELHFMATWMGTIDEQYIYIYCDTWNIWLWMFGCILTHLAIHRDFSKTQMTQGILGGAWRLVGPTIPKNRCNRMRCQNVMTCWDPYYSYLYLCYIV